MAKTKTITFLLIVNALETICSSERGKETDISSNDGFSYSSLNEKIHSLRKLGSSNNQCEYDSDKDECVPTSNKIKSCDDYEIKSNTECIPCEYGKANLDGKTCVNECEYNSELNRCVDFNNSAINCSGFIYTGTAPNFECTRCGEGKIADESGKECIIACVYNSSENQCLKAPNFTEPCTDHGISGKAPNFECAPCGEGKISLNGKECINECEYDSKENKCVKLPDLNVTCTGYEVTGSYPNFKCTKCADGLESDGVTCVKKCSFDSDENRCALKNDSTIICANYEPRTTGKTCVKKCSFDSANSQCVLDSDPTKPCTGFIPQKKSKVFSCKACPDDEYSKDGKTCEKQCKYDAKSNSCLNVSDTTSTSPCKDYRVTGTSPNFKCTKCPDGESSENGVTCVKKCKYLSKEHRCVSTLNETIFCNDYGVTGESPNFECTKCPDGESSENRATCVKLCLYDKNENQCVSGNNDTVNCTNFVYTGTAPDFECTKCPDGETSENGKTCVKECKYNENKKACYINGTEGTVTCNLVPVEASYECVPCDDGQTSTDGKTCVKDEQKEEEEEENKKDDEKEGDEKKDDNKKDDDKKDDNECSSACSSCSSFFSCDTCKNGNEQINGRCQTCMEIIPGCDECEDKVCRKCLKSFVQNGNSCTGQGKIGRPTFLLVGFSNFSRKNEIVTFILYLRIKVGMMFNANISFTLNVTSSGRRFLTFSGKGEGVQNDIAKGTYSQNNSTRDFLAVFDCKAVDVKDGDKIQLVDDLKLTQVNNDTTEENIRIPISLVGKDISKCGDINQCFDSKYLSNNTLYTFKQAGSRRRLEEGKATIDGTVETDDPIDLNFNLKIENESDYVNCNLRKKEKQQDAELICDAKNYENGFYLEDDYVASGTTANMAFSGNKKINQDKTDSDSGSYSSSSSSSLSGGAIAGIVIGCIAVVAIIGTIIFFVSKGTALFGAGNAAAAYSEAGTSSVSNMNVPNLKK